MPCREALHFANKILTGENFSFKLTINFSFNFLTSKIILRGRPQLFISLRVPTAFLVGWPQAIAFPEAAIK